MRPHWLTSLAREAFCWYLRRFPWRDGKEFFYQHFHRTLAPLEGWLILRLSRGFTLRLDLADRFNASSFSSGTTTNAGRPT